MELTKRSSVDIRCELWRPGEGMAVGHAAAKTMKCLDDHVLILAKCVRAAIDLSASLG